MNRTFCLCLLVCFLLYGCQNKEYPPIQDDLPFIATLNVKESSIDFILEDGSQLAKWKFDKSYTGATLLNDGNTLVLYSPELEKVDFYTLSTGLLVNSLNVGKGITNVIEIHEQSIIAMADKQKNQVHFYDLSGKKMKSVNTESTPMEMETDGEHLYVASFKGETLSIFRLSDIEFVGEIPIQPTSTGILLRKEEQEVWLGGHGEGSKVQSHIHIYSLVDKKLKMKLYAPLMPVDFIENEFGIFAISHGSNKLYHFNHDKEYVNQVEVGANPFALDYFSGEMIVAGYDSNELYWVHPVTLEVKQQVKVGEGPFEILTREKVN